MRNSFSCVTKTLISFVCRSLGIILLKAVWACRMKIIPSPPTESLWWQMWWQFLWKIELMNEIGSYDPMTSPLWYEKLCEILPSGVILPKMAIMILTHVANKCNFDFWVGWVQIVNICLVEKHLWVNHLILLLLKPQSQLPSRVDMGSLSLKMSKKPV